MAPIMKLRAGLLNHEDATLWRRWISGRAGARSKVFTSTFIRIGPEPDSNIERR
jgi:hypothetical protein